MSADSLIEETPQHLRLEIGRANEELNSVKHDMRQADKDLIQVRLDVQGIRGELKELRTTIIGMDGNNGLRGEVRTFMGLINIQDKKLEDRLIAYERGINKRMDIQESTLLASLKEFKEIFLEQNKQYMEMREETTKRLEEIDKLQIENEAQQNTFETSFDTYKNIERGATCYGIKALNEYKKENAKEFVELQKTRITMIGTMIAALLATIGSILGVILKK